MKKVIGFILGCLLLASSIGFAEGLPPYKPMEIDGRVKLIVESPGNYMTGNRFEDVKFLRNGGIAYQVTKTETVGNEDVEIRETMLYLYSGKIGGPYAHQKIPQLEFIDDISNTNFLVETNDDHLFFTDLENLFAIQSDLNNDPVSLPLGAKGNQLVESKGDSILYLDGSQLGKSEQRSSSPIMTVVKLPGGYKNMDQAKQYYVMAHQFSEVMGNSEYQLIAANFGETEDSIYALVDTKGNVDQQNFQSAENTSSDRYLILQLEMAFDDAESIQFEVTERIPIHELFQSEDFMSMQFNGTDFVLSYSMESKESLSSRMMRVDGLGQIYDSIELPGLVLNFDVKGDLTLATIISPYEQDQGLYLIDWNKTESKSAPRALIAERTMHGKTLAVFRDQGYGLLRKEELDTGIVDYLAPLKSEESDVILRIPLCDILAKLNENTRYLEILYGEERIDILMSALNVQALLEKMPCETDATIEIHLTKKDDGHVVVSAELFVVEQVDASTKRVHRMPIELP